MLKDAASASIYGSRAAAGVILVSTKRAKNNQLKMSYNYEYGIDMPTAMPKYARARDWMIFKNELTYNDGGDDLYGVYSQDFIAVSYTHLDVYKRQIQGCETDRSRWSAH